jgi:hypothetical protein
MANCTGMNQQYGTMANCLHSCSVFPVGAASDISGNTLGCRIYHANAAMKTNNPTLHCPHAGPGGGGACGADCVGYCQLAMHFCTPAMGAMMIYTDNNDCMNTCAMFATTKTLNVNDTVLQGQKQVACLLYHAQEASSDPPDHCNGDLAKTATLASTTCKDP